MKDRYFIDKRVGVILVIDGNIQEKQNCVQEYSNQAVRLKINGKRSSDGDWFLPAGAEDFCKSYIDFLRGIMKYLVAQDNNAKNLCDGIGSPMGTSQYYNIGLCLITDGVKELREKFDCAWLITKIAVMIRKVYIEKEQPTQVWKLCVKSNQATLYCLGYPLPPDYDVDEVVYYENIRYTDLPDGEMLFKVGLGAPPIICLPIED